MKFRGSFLLVLMLAAVGCATDAAVQPATNDRQPVNEATGACGEAANKCAETISAAFDSKGVLWIVWADKGHAYVQTSADKGVSFSLPVKVNSVAENIEAKGEYRPKIKPDAQGNIYLSWTQRLEGKHSGHIRFSRSTDGGQHFSEPVTVNDNLDVIGHRFDSMSIGKDGEIFIAWLDARDVEAEKKAGKKFEGSSLYYSWSDDGGQHFYPNKRIATHTCQCCRLDTAIAPDNTPVVIWRHVFDGGLRDHALVKFNDWRTPGDTHRVGRDNWKIDACPHHGPSLSVSDAAIYHAVWFSGSAAKPGLFYAYSTDAGRHFSKPVNFGKQGAGHPHVLALGSRVNVVWQEFDGTNNVVKLIKSADDGKNWSQPVVLAQTARSGDQPFLVSDRQKIYLSWKTQQQDYGLISLDDK